MESKTGWLLWAGAALLAGLLAACRPVQAPATAGQQEPAVGATMTAAAAGGPSWAGDWEGAIDILGQKLTIVVHMVDAGGSLTGAMDIPQQGAHGLPIYDITTDGRQIAFAILSGPRRAGFHGARQDDGSIGGSFEQSGVQGTFHLAPGAAAAVTVAPTAPAAPLPYRAEEVTYTNGTATLAGTLTIPSGAGPFPAVLLLSGSGQQDRNNEISLAPGYRLFADLADALTRQGIAVLRVDDRGIGGSIGEVEKATTADFAGDARAGVSFLKSRPALDPHKIGLLGHSEGGNIAALAASGNADVAFAVLLAGPGVSGAEVLVKQVERIAASTGEDEPSIQRVAALERQALDLAKAQDWAGLYDLIAGEVRRQIEELPAAQRSAITDVDKVVADRTAAQVTAMQSPWMQFFLAYDPAVDWSKVKAPVLALFGKLDVQVDAEQNAAGLKAAFAHGGNPQLTVKVYPAANHLFQAAKTGAVDEYAELSNHYVPTLFDDIAAWIHTAVGQ